MSTILGVALPGDQRRRIWSSKAPNSGLYWTFDVRGEAMTTLFRFASATNGASFTSRRSARCQAASLTVGPWQSFLQEIEELQGSLTRQCVACLRYWVDPAERWWMYLDDEDRPILYCVDCAVG